MREQYLYTPEDKEKIESIDKRLQEIYNEYTKLIIEKSRIQARTPMRYDFDPIDISSEVKVKNLMRMGEPLINRTAIGKIVFGDKEKR